MVKCRCSGLAELASVSSSVVVCLLGLAYAFMDSFCADWGTANGKVVMGIALAEIGVPSILVTDTSDPAFIVRKRC